MKIGILGYGKMGSWLAQELAKKHEVAIYDNDEGRTASAAGITVLGSIKELKKFAPDLLVNAVTLKNTVAAFEEAVPFLPENCLISDMASVKGPIAEYYKKCGMSFVSVHPMFGPTFANVQSLKDENAVIIKEGDDKGKAFFRELFSALELHIFEYTFAGHDKMMSYSLTTPFAASMVFAACVDKTTVPGTTFARHRAIARGLLSEEDNLLAEVLFNDQSLEQLGKITARLEFMKHIIKAKDHEEAVRFFNKLRKNLE